MKPYGSTDSAVSVASELQTCWRCGSSARITNGLCLGCMLEPALGGEGSDGAALAALLNEIDLNDADWRVGNYQILEEIGRGGMGVIYRARQRHSKRIVALKRVLSFHADSRETLARFRREAEAAASLDHPNILPIYEVGETEDKLPFFSMKLAVGGTLLQAKQLLRNQPREIVRLMSKVTRAVQYAHGQGILHRDLKPGNVLLDGRVEPLVSDFGLAKWLDTSSDLTRTLTIFGTPGYIAPEQANGPAAGLKPSADIYSLGAILFDLIAGRPPFLGEHALAVIKQAEQKPAPKLRTLVSECDRDLETICARCLERESPARYQSAHDLATDLELWLEGRPIIARPVSPPVRIWRWSKRNRKLAASIAACVVLGAAATAFLAQNRLAERASATAMHSIAVEPFLDLDSASYDAKTSGVIASALQRDLSRYGPSRVAVAHGELPSNSEPKARTSIRGTKRVRDGKLRLSLRLLNAADGKVLYKKIIETTTADPASDIVARTVGAQMYAILNIGDLSSAELTENDPGWRDPKTRELLIAGKAVMDRRSGIDMDRAAELFVQAIKIQPSSALAHSYLADVQYGRAFVTGDMTLISAAEAEARAAMKLNPASPESHKAICLVLFEQGHFPDALEQAFEGFELAEHDDSGLVRRVAAICRTSGQPGKAAAWYGLVVDRDARPGFYEFSLADCLTDLGDDERAAEIYRRSSTLFPELPEGWMGLCRLALLKKDFPTAKRISSENWNRYREHMFSEEMAAQVAFFSRDYDQAERIYKDLAAKDPNGGGSFYGRVSYQSALGRLRLVANDEEAGTPILKAALDKEAQALRTAPQHPEILYRVAAIESSLGKTQAALNHLRAASDTGWIDYRSAVIDPRFDAISKDPEFQTIISSAEVKVRQQRENFLSANKP